ncbi:MAG: ATP-binding protein, partial [Caulobacteraceae bacterium]
IVPGRDLGKCKCDPGQLEQVIMNLVVNARDAMPEGGKLTIETANVYLDLAYVEANPDAAAGQYVMVALTDTGSGMSREILAQVFEPFFTTKGPGSGTGLGLSQVHGFIKQSGGHVALYSEPGLGTSAKLYLPRSYQPAAPAPERPLAPAVQSGPASALTGLAVLVAEDEAGVREFTREALEGLGCRPILADGGEEALAILAARDDVALLLTDVVMPGVNGRALAERAMRLRPEIAVLYMTGYTRNAIVHNGILDPDAQLISKPFTVAELAAQLDAALARRLRSATAASDAEAEA